MGSSESHIATENNDNNDNIYTPNLLAKQIISNNESKSDQNKKNSDKSQKDAETYSIQDQEKLNFGKNQDKDNYINRNNDFIILNKRNIYNGNDLITNVNRSQNYNKNIYISHTAESIKMEITNQKRDLPYRKFKFNGITVIQNLKDYIPDHISKEEIKEMVFNAFGEGIVDNNSNYYIPGKTVTREQANAIVDLIERYIKTDSNVENLQDNSILNGVNLTIDLVDLNKEIIKEKMFKGKEPTDVQLENILKNLSQGQKNVKILSIEFQ